VRLLEREVLVIDWTKLFETLRYLITLAGKEIPARGHGHLLEVEIEL
jgi:hypothetical protein